MTEPSVVDPQAEKASRGSSALRIAAVVAALLLLFLAARELGHWVPTFAEYVDGLGVWGPAVFIVGYALSVVAFAPGALLTLAGGAIFGLVEGSVVVFIAATIGSALAFLVARYLARGAVEQRIAGNERFAAVDRAVGREGLKIVFLLRLSPAFPFSFLNYALGLTSVSFRDYVLASVGMVPGTVLYVYYGKLIGDVAALAGGASPDRDASSYVLLGVGLVATIAVTALVTRIARRALREATGESA